jgi:hypothetical protein
VESQKSICDWGLETFGPITELRPCAERATDEMREFQLAIDQGCDPDALLAEAADIVITLYRLAGHLGRDLHAEIDRKMAINRARRWIPDGKGNGQHVRTANSPSAPRNSAVPRGFGR